MIPSDAQWPSTPLWEAAADRHAYAHQVYWQEADRVRKYVVDTLREQGGEAHLACALDARLIVAHLSTLPLELCPDVQSEIDDLVARCRASSSSPRSAISQLAGALAELRVSDNPVLRTTRSVARDVTGDRRSVQILLPPATPKRWVPLIESSVPGITVVPFASRLDAPVTASAIVTGASDRYGGNVDRYNPNADLRGAWIIHAVPAYEVHVVSVLESLEDEPKGIVFDGPGLPVRLHTASRASRGPNSQGLDHEIGRLLGNFQLPPPHATIGTIPVAEARRVLLSDGDYVYLDATDPKAVLTIFGGRFRQIGVVTREAGTWLLDAGARIVLRSTTSEREAINTRAYELLGSDGPAARTLLEQLQEGSVDCLRVQVADVKDGVETYLRGWATTSLCFPTKHVGVGHRAAVLAGRPLDASDVNLLGRVRTYRQLAGASLIEDVTSTLEGLIDDWEIEGHDDLDTEAGVLHLRTVAAVDRTTLFHVAHNQLGRLHRERTV